MGFVLIAFCMLPLAYFLTKKGRPNGVDAYQRGYVDYGPGRANSNPFAAGTKEAAEWEKGYQAAHEYWAW
jgi:hypothetical protein